MRSTNEVYASLAYNGAPLLHIPVCVSRAVLISATLFTLDEPILAKLRLFSRAVTVDALINALMH